MALTPGARLGPYEILAPIGAGGMGEVYRARDTHLGRDVAIKVLPDEFAQDAERLARFEREARSLATLNHPNIAAVYGLEKSSSPCGLVMELVEGPTLAERIGGRPMPLEEAVAVGRQIAEAIQAAHAQGIVHRDLKPANIKVRADGTVKVLDFGLAKVLDDGPSSVARAQSAPSTVSQSPTITSPVQLRQGYGEGGTLAGVLLGTAAYMSPEQAKGRPADKRSDIWAFGCVLFEMLSGRRAFEGEDVSDTLAAVLRAEPDWTALKPDVPAQLQLLLKKSLAKDPRERPSDIAVASFLLINLVAPSQSRTLSGGPRRSMFIGAGIGTLVGAALAAFAAWTMTSSNDIPSEPVRFEIVQPPDQPVALNPDRVIAISPDGKTIVYRAGITPSESRLFVRSLADLSTRPLGDAEGTWPFFSPDGRWVGFFEAGELKKVAMAGGKPVTLCRYEGAPRGASWDADGTIVFATSDGRTGLQIVPSDGGAPRALTRPDTTRGEVDHIFPSLLPEGRGVLASSVDSMQSVFRPEILVFDRQTGERKAVIGPGSQAEYLASGHLVYTADGAFHAVGFNLERFQTTGERITLPEELTAFSATGAMNAAFSKNGTFAYVPRPEGSSARSLVWVGRDGREEAHIAAPPRAYVAPRLSPDGRRIAVHIFSQSGQGGQQIWIWDFERGTLIPLTSDPGQDQFPVWTRDGKRLIFASSRSGVMNLHWLATDGTGTTERLTTSPNRQFAPFSVAPDGRVTFVEINPETGQDIHLLTVDGQRHVERLIHTSAIEMNAAVSPDGRFVAYQSNQGNQMQIYVRPFPNVDDGFWQVTTDVGVMPVWSPKGDELFYVDGRAALTAVPVQTSGAAFTFGAAVKLFDTVKSYETRYFVYNNVRTYDVSPDGQRFLMLKNEAASSEVGAPASKIVVVLNWFDELKRLAPVK